MYFVDVEELVDREIATRDCHTGIKSIDATTFELQDLSTPGKHNLHTAQYATMQNGIFELFIDAFYEYEITRAVRHEFVRYSERFSDKLFVVKTCWLPKMDYFGLQWDAIIFVDQNPEIQVDRLVNLGFDQYSAERYIDMQFENVLPAMSKATIILDDLMNITKVINNDDIEPGTLR